MDVPTPGWLAAALTPGGTPVALALLGVVASLDDGRAGDEAICAWMRRLADTDDTVWALNQHYVALEEEHPYLRGFLGAITGWTENPGSHHYDIVRQLAGRISNVAWSEVEPDAGGDILGMVKNQMDSIGARRTKVFDYISVAEFFAMTVIDYFPRSMGRFIDVWCGSGTRALGAIKYQQFIGMDVDFPILLNDPSPTAVAMAGLNMISQPVPEVQLRCDRAYAESWAGTWDGRAPSIRRQLPPELLAEVGVEPLKPKRLT